MAGEWIKIERSTMDKPEILRVARILGIDKDAVLGKLIRLWAWFDVVSVDGVVDGVVESDIDTICFQSGLSAALVSVGWLAVDNAAAVVSIPNFDRHNGESAKKRALKSEAQARWRAKKGNRVDGCESTPESTNTSTREEKRRDSKQTILGDASQATPTEPESSKDSNPRGSRLPDDWQLPKALGDWALKERPTWTPEHVRLEAEKFADYWHGRPGAAGRKSDWPATWRNWIRNANGTPAMPASATPRLAAI